MYFISCTIHIGLLHVLLNILLIVILSIICILRHI